MDWPEYYPNECPPDYAPSASGVIYRFVDTNPPAGVDFVPYAQEYPNRNWGDKECQACGLSVYTSLDDCEKVKRKIPSLRKKLTAAATLDPSQGKLMNTPSRKINNHYTWWFPKELLEPWVLFAIVNH